DESKIRDNEQFMQEIETNSLVRDSTGQLIRLTYPQSYYTAQSENFRLQSEIKDLKDSMKSMQDEARRVQQQLPIPKYSGIQKLIDVEGTPRIGSAPAASAIAPKNPETRPSPPVTQPATMPATMPGKSAY